MPSRSLTVPLISTALVFVMQHKDPVPRELGFVKDGYYHHIATGVEFPVPKNWSVLSASGSSEDGEQVFLGDDATPESYVAIWLKKERHTPADVDAMLNAAAALKRQQRDGRDTQRYTFRPNSIRHTVIGGRKAVRATADFVVVGKPQVEYFTWIFTERTRVQFDVRGDDPDASQTEMRFQQIVRAARIP
ncbi:MAG TPA: hypothetical protein VGY48_24405 [Vicinamibacterales bacterium]|nr:hypothetical protein [Vicinamibacterales bacterium]